MFYPYWIKAVICYILYIHISDHSSCTLSYACVVQYINPEEEYTDPEGGIFYVPGAGSGGGFTNSWRRGIH